MMRINYLHTGGHDQYVLNRFTEMEYNARFRNVPTFVNALPTSNNNNNNNNNNKNEFAPPAAPNPNTMNNYSYTNNNNNNANANLDMLDINFMNINPSFNGGMNSSRMAPPPANPVNVSGRQPTAAAIMLNGYGNGNGIGGSVSGLARSRVSLSDLSALNGK
jgi:hypothetical protein